jgi:hypothetical protein
VHYLPNMPVDIPVVYYESYTYIQEPKIKLYISRASLNLVISATLQIFQLLIFNRAQRLSNYKSLHFSVRQYRCAQSVIVK